jgi:GxxExxY protein
VREGNSNHEEIGRIILDSAMKVHSALGCGLLESAYEACLAHELIKRGVAVERQVALPVVYDGYTIDAGYRVDLLVNKIVMVELKAVEKILNVHQAQIMSYLKLSGCRLGYLLNFNVVHLKDGIKRVVNGL